MFIYPFVISFYKIFTENLMSKNQLSKDLLRSSCSSVL